MYRADNIAYRRAYTAIPQISNVSSKSWCTNFLHAEVTVGDDGGEHNLVRTSHVSLIRVGLIPAIGQHNFALFGTFMHFIKASCLN